MEQRRSTLKTFVVAFAIFSMLFTVGSGLMVLANLGNIGRVVKVVTLIKTKAIQPVGTGELIEGAAVGIVNSLKDPYSTYMGPEVYKNLTEHMKGAYGGVGLLVSMEQESRLTVVSPFKGTPAQKAGILSGDWILRIDGEDTTKMTLEEAANKMQGEPGLEVTLTVWREGFDAPKDYAITREIINIPSVEGQMLKHSPEIAYINITQFSEHTGKELDKVLEELKEFSYKGIILDLRNNPGGVLPAALDVAARFIPKGPIVHIVDKNNTETYEAPGSNIQVPLVVLVNKGSASASEIVSGAIKDTGAGTLVGERTFGKGLVQTVFPLAGGAAVKLTTAKYLTPNKIDINKTGIEPNVAVELPKELEREVLLYTPNETKDPQLKKAVEILKSKF